MEAEAAALGQINAVAADLNDVDLTGAQRRQLGSRLQDAANGQPLESWLDAPVIRHGLEGVVLPLAVLVVAIRSRAYRCLVGFFFADRLHVRLGGDPLV